MAEGGHGHHHATNHRRSGAVRARGRFPREHPTHHLIEQRSRTPFGAAGSHDRLRARAIRERTSSRGIGGARGRERAGPTRSHPEPGRDPAQRRRVLRGRPRGRRGRRGHLRFPGSGTLDGSRWWRGVEQWQLVGLITQRSGVRIPPPLPSRNAGGRKTAGVLRSPGNQRSFQPKSPSCVTASCSRAISRFVRTESAGKAASKTESDGNSSRKRIATSRSRRRR